MASASSYPELRKFLAHADASYHLTDLPVEEIRSSLVEWYAQHRRHLPWRGDAPPYNGSTAGFAQRAAASSTAPASTAAAPAAVSAYGVWVSEIMCQQTRVEAVIPYWLTWMEAFPTVEALAAASEDEVNAKWAGLGFYRRARMLHEGAKQVVESHGGELPRDVAGLLSIKGIGPYTAGAVASIVGGVAAPVVDGNVLRVVSRLCAVAATAKEPLLCDEKRGVAWTVARALVEAGGGAEPGALNQALMEVGATYCAPAGSGVDGADPLAPFYSLDNARPRGVCGAPGGRSRGAARRRDGRARRRLPVEQGRRRLPRRAARGGRGADGGGGGDDRAPAAAAAAGEEGAARGAARGGRPLLRRCGRRGRWCGDADGATLAAGEAAGDGAAGGAVGVSARGRRVGRRGGPGRPRRSSARSRSTTCSWLLRRAARSRRW